MTLFHILELPSTSNQICKKCVAYLMRQVAVGSRARGVELSGGADDAICAHRSPLWPP